MLYTTYEINQIKRSLTDNFNEMIKQLDFIEYNKKILPSPTYSRMENIKLAKKFVDYLLLGISFDDAVEYLSIDFHVSQGIIDHVLKPTYDHLMRKEMHKNIYLTHKMNKSGYSTKQIAEVIGKTPATVRNYLKISAIL